MPRSGRYNSRGEPQAEPSGFGRLTENGTGPVAWGHTTPFSLEECLVPSYWSLLAAGGRGGVQVLDRIEITARCESDSPTLAVLLVRRVAPDEGLHCQVVERHDMPPFKVAKPAAKAEAA